MKEYLRPLGIFIGGNLLLLILWLFLPTIGNSATQLAADTAEHASTFWGWAWVVSSIKILIVIIGELGVLFAAGWAFLHSKS